MRSVSESQGKNGKQPYPVVQPRSLSEVSDQIREAVARQQGIYAQGGRTLWDLGGAPSRPGTILDMTALAAVQDYPARDMTITVQAGITLAALQSTLACEHQWLPVDVAHPERATLGGALATNASGPRRYGYGTLRDYVIGISFMTDAGEEVKAGGRVVKNVAGYDLMKLQTGALGTLGVITLVTLKVKPKPESASVTVFGCQSVDLAAVLDGLHASASRPVVLELWNQAAWRELQPGLATNADWIIAVGFEEKSVTTAWQRETLHQELASRHTEVIAQREGAEAEALWQQATDLQVRASSPHITKLSVFPSQTAATLASLAALPGVLLHAEPLSGIVWAHSQASLVESPCWPSPASVQVRRAPEPRKGPGILGWDDSARKLMYKIKATIDPHNIFNPGRLPLDG